MTPKKSEYEDMESPKIEEIDQAAEKLCDALDAARMALMTVKETERAAKKFADALAATELALITVVKKHRNQLSIDSAGNRIYKFDDRMFLMTRKVGVKFKEVAQLRIREILATDLGGKVGVKFKEVAQSRPRRKARGAD